MVNKKVKYYFLLISFFGIATNAYADAASQAQAQAQAYVQKATGLYDAQKSKIFSQFGLNDFPNNFKNLPLNFLGEIPGLDEAKQAFYTAKMLPEMALLAAVPLPGVGCPRWNVQPCLCLRPKFTPPFFEFKIASQQRTMDKFSEAGQKYQSQLVSIGPMLYNRLKSEFQVYLKPQEMFKTIKSNLKQGKLPGGIEIPMSTDSLKSLLIVNPFDRQHGRMKDVAYRAIAANHGREATRLLSKVSEANPLWYFFKAYAGVHEIKECTGFLESIKDIKGEKCKAFIEQAKNKIMSDSPLSTLTDAAIAETGDLASLKSSGLGKNLRLKFTSLNPEEDGPLEDGSAEVKKGTRRFKVAQMMRNYHLDMFDKWGIMKYAGAAGIDLDKLDEINFGELKDKFDENFDETIHDVKDKAKDMYAKRKELLAAARTRGQCLMKDLGHGAIPKGLLPNNPIFAAGMKRTLPASTEPCMKCGGGPLVPFSVSDSNSTEFTALLNGKSAFNAMIMARTQLPGAFSDFKPLRPNSECTNTVDKTPDILSLDGLIEAGSQIDGMSEQDFKDLGEDILNAGIDAVFSRLFGANFNDFDVSKYVAGPFTEKLQNHCGTFEKPQLSKVDASGKVVYEGYDEALSESPEQRNSTVQVGWTFTRGCPREWRDTIHIPFWKGGCSSFDYAE